MIEIAQSEDTAYLADMFDFDVPNAHRCFGVLDGVVLGTILTDDASNPTWAVVREAALGITFVGGVIDESDLADVVNELRKTDVVGISFWPDEPKRYTYPTGRADYVKDLAIQFTHRSNENANLDDLTRNLPEGCELRPMDAELMVLCQWSDLAARAYGSVHAFLDQSLGFCLMRGDEILSEAYATFYSRDVYELGTITHERHRGLGYSTITCAQAIKVCEERGGETVWVCQTDNLSSAAAARKLGYTLERRFGGILYKAVNAK